MTQSQNPEPVAGQSERTARRIQVGVVVSNKVAKTITVQIERTFRHPKYGKYVRKREKYHAHTEVPVNVGDEVEIMSIRPMSALKRWRLVRVVKAAADRGVEISAIGGDQIGGQS